MEVGDGRAERWSVIADGSQAAVSLMPDVDGTGSGSLLEPDACLHLWKFTTWGFICRGLTGVPGQTEGLQGHESYLSFSLHMWHPG